MALRLVTILQSIRSTAKICREMGALVAEVIKAELG